jgi:hypothetical protein
MDRHLRALRRTYLDNPSPETAIAWANAQLRSEGSPEITWGDLEVSSDPDIVSLVATARRAVRAVVKTYLGDTEWGKKSGYKTIPLSKLVEIPKAHWRLIEGVGRAKTKAVDQLFGRHGFDWDDGDQEAAELDYEYGVFGSETRGPHTEMSRLLMAWRARCLQLEGLVPVTPDYEELPELEASTCDVEDLDPWPTLNEDDWAERAMHLPEVLLDDLTRMFESA